MELIPAIDIKDGACVRLYQGDYDQATLYGTDPAAMARRWVAEGASRLHLVDLDGAKAGEPINLSAVRAIVQAVQVPTQLGGGLRTLDAIEAVLAAGVSRVILGTVAVRDPQLVAQAVARFGAQIIVGIDARDGRVATSGWTELADVQASELAQHMAAVGVARIIYTDIARDGTLTEPNYAATAALVRPGGPAIIASGGIAQTDHLLRLAACGVEGAIVGRALYTNAIALPAALAALRERETDGTSIKPDRKI
jgi:phosphoribosylformimino-5-aminoimidazole carboxamide ribotide isomerase